MDGDFQTHYLTAEQAYGAGDFRTAQSITVDLLSQLDGMAETNTDQDALLAWRAFVALLAGNIHLYGLNEPDQACGFYELVLASNPQDTLKDLAEQGLERIQTRRGHGDEVVDPAPATSPPRSTLIQDPFLTQSSAGGFNAGLGSQHDASQASATPWLDGPPPRKLKPRSPRLRLPRRDGQGGRDGCGGRSLTPSQAPRSRSGLLNRKRTKRRSSLNQSQNQT